MARSVQDEKVVADPVPRDSANFVSDSDSDLSDADKKLAAMGYKPVSHQCLPLTTDTRDVERQLDFVTHGTLHGFGLVSMVPLPPLPLPLLLLRPHLETSYTCQ